MKNRYIPFIQQKYCCLPACLQMIIYKNWFPLLSQEEIWWNLWLIVSEDDAWLFGNVRTWTEPHSWRWTQVYKIPYSVNWFFRKNKMRLMEKNFFLTKVWESRKFIQDSIDLDNDIIVCFNYAKLYWEWNDWWHLSVIESMEWDEITLIDPSYNTPKFRKVALKDLLKAVSYHWKENVWWFWLITKW